MLRKILQKVMGDPNAREIKRLRITVEKINAIEKDLQNLTDDQLKNKTIEFKAQIENGKTLDELLPEAFAVVKNACRRLVGKKWKVRGEEVEWNMIPFDVQLIGGMVLHYGKISEMKTGEGKTLVATLPLYLNALAGKGAFLVTVNNYLAQRDAEWMSGLFNFLGLTVGVVDHGMEPAQRKEAYGMDITYITNNELGFDYLRDNMAIAPEQIVQRELNFAIVDEVDSILIDEARTPLIISAPAEESTAKYRTYSQLIQRLVPEKHYAIDEKLKTAVLTEEGIAEMEKLLGLKNIYTEAGYNEVHHIEQSLKARACYNLDKDYVIKDGQVIIVDEFTGRLMPGRRWSDGLHQAVEAKEGVEVCRESKTLATITFQNLFRLFKKLAGMTGTASTEAEEFIKIYGLETIIIPTHKSLARQDLSDSVYKNEQGKFSAVTQKIKELHEKGQPVLVGTISIEKSEKLSRKLMQEGIPHEVLNAKHHEKEAHIIAKAGQRGAVTIATNMAGRGTDIKLEAGVDELGGLFILGTERHESRRIDNQLRGRAGRQGDSGASQFFVSMDDTLMRIFGGERMKNIMTALKVPEDLPIENRLISRSIESAQEKVEAHNFDIRKHVVEYDDVMNKHREIIYSRRRKVLFSSDIKTDILQLITEEAEGLARTHVSGRRQEEWNINGIFEIANAWYVAKEDPLTLAELQSVKDEKELEIILKDFFLDEYEQREKALPNGAPLRHAEKMVYLRTIDDLWKEHMDDMTALRESVALHGYGQRDPLIEYKKGGYEFFKNLLFKIRTNTVRTLFKLDFAIVLPAMPQVRPTQILTNEAEVEDILTGDRKLISEMEKQSQEIVEGVESQQSTKKENITTIRVSDDEKTTTLKNSIKETGRNELCSCGSGKKYKKCCGRF